MQYKILGRTGLNVSVAGLGCGGHSRLGQTYGNSEEQSIAVVSAALDLGINFVDTAAAYGTEKIVGAAVKGRRAASMLMRMRSPSANLPLDDTRSGSHSIDSGPSWLMILSPVSALRDGRNRQRVMPMTVSAETPVTET